MKERSSSFRSADPNTTRLADLTITEFRSVMQELITDISREQARHVAEDAPLTTGEAIAALRCSRSTFHELVRSGRIQVAKLREGKGSSRVLVPRSEIERLLRTQQREA